MSNNPSPRPPWADWFDGRQAIQELPEQCARHCSAQGPVDDAVAYWRPKLQLEAPPWLLREYLRGYGAWDRAQLCDHKANLERLLWVWACNVQEDPDYLPYLG